MKLQKTTFDDAWLIATDPAFDERGYFARTFCAREFRRHGLHASYVQHSTSYSRLRGTLRGMHFQRPPHAEVKVVSCLRGAIWDVIIDLRPDSPRFCNWQAFELSADNRTQLYIPAGFAHGFQTLTKDTEVAYLISEFYEPAAASGVRHDDPAFNISWPLPVAVISQRDTSWAEFKV